jgi:hypothetical protein
MTVGATSVQAYMVLVVQVVDPMDWVVTRAVGIVLAARGILDMKLRSCWTVRSRRTNLVAWLARGKRACFNIDALGNVAHEEG